MRPDRRQHVGKFSVSPATAKTVKQMVWRDGRVAEGAGLLNRNHFFSHFPQRFFSLFHGTIVTCPPNLQAVWCCQMTPKNRRGMKRGMQRKPSDGFSLSQVRRHVHRLNSRSKALQSKPATGSGDRVEVTGKESIGFGYPSPHPTPKIAQAANVRNGFRERRISSKAQCLFFASINIPDTNFIFLNFQTPDQDV